MALIVEDGTGRADAVSYATVAEADAYLTARGKGDTWNDLGDDEKGAYLINGADYLTQTYRMGWAGYRVQTTQALDWPRYEVPMPDAAGGEAYYPSDSVPAEVKKAQIEAAFRFITGELSPDESAPVIERTVGPITTRYAQGDSQAPKFPVIDRLVAPLMGSRGSLSAKVVRT